MGRLRRLLQNRLIPPLSRENPVKNAGCSEFEVDNWAISRFVTEKLTPCVGVHPFPLNELMLMVAAVCWLRPAQVFDWGTNIGKSARIFYDCTSHYGIDAEIHSTDLPDDISHVEHPGHKRGELVRGLPRVHLHQGDGVATSLEIWRTAGRKPRPLFLIDGDHRYESVSHELRLIVTEVPDPGILLHDSFYQSTESGYNIGPHQAIEDVLALSPGRFRRLESGLGLPGMTFLYLNNNR
jgi:cephalosporin hydroxylase